MKRSLPTRREVLVLCLLLLACLSIRVALLAVGSELRPFGDQITYLHEGQQILDGDRTDAYRGPGYPAYIAACSWLMGKSVTSVRIGNVVLSGLLVLLMWALGRELFSPRTGLLAAGWMAFYPRSIVITQYVFSENLYTVCVVSGIWLSCVAMRRSSRLACIGAGVAFGIGILTREMLVYFLPIVAVIPVLVSRRAMRERVLHAALIVVTSLVVVLPWTARNYAVHSRFMLVGHSDGVALFEGNYPGEGRNDVRQRRVQLQRWFLIESGQSPVVMNDKFEERAWYWIRVRQPTWIFEKIASNGPLLIRPNKWRDVLWGDWSMLGEHEERVRKVLLLALFLPVHLATLLLGALGLAWWRIRGRENLPLMYLLFSILVHIVANAGHFRFAYPFEWILCLAGAVALDRGPPRSPGRRVVAGLIVALIVVSQLAIHDVWIDAFQ